jgi:hypothetical protein
MPVAKRFLHQRPLHESTAEQRERLSDRSSDCDASEGPLNIKPCRGRRLETGLPPMSRNEVRRLNTLESAAPSLSAQVTSEALEALT